MKPLQHAKISANKHGGKWEDYIDIHEFFDQTKAQVPDMRHRAILHNSMGIFIARQVFGEVRINSAGREYSVRDIGEDHVLEDLGTIPTLVEVINCIDTKHLKWLGGLPKNKRTLVTKVPNKREGTKVKLTIKADGMAICEDCGSQNPIGTDPIMARHEDDCETLKRIMGTAFPLNPSTLIPGVIPSVDHESPVTKEYDVIPEMKEEVPSPPPAPYHAGSDDVCDGAVAGYRAWQARNRHND